MILVWFNPPMPSTTVALGPRARKLLYYISTGRSSEEIAEKFAIKRATLKVHIKNLFRRLSVTDRVQAVLVARQLGLLPSPDPYLGRLGNVQLELLDKKLLRLAARGLTYPEIAAELGLSTRHVKYRMTRLFPRLGVQRRELAVLKALHLGLILAQDLAR